MTTREHVMSAAFGFALGMLIGSSIVGGVAIESDEWFLPHWHAEARFWCRQYVAETPNSLVTCDW